MRGESLGFCKAENPEKILVGDVGTNFSVQETQKKPFWDPCWGMVIVNVTLSSPSSR